MNKEMNVVEIETLLKNVLNNNVSEKDKENAAVLLKALATKREEQKVQKIIVQIDTDSDFGIEHSEIYNIETLPNGLYQIVVKVDKNEDKGQALIRCLESLEYRTQGSTRTVVDDLIGFVKTSLSHLPFEYSAFDYGNASIYVYDKVCQDKINLPELKINFN